MRVLLFNWRDIRNPNAGGAEVFTHEVLKRLVDRGHEATLFTSAFESCKQRETIDGVEVIRSGGKYTVYLEAKKHYRRSFKGEFDVVIDEINTRPFMTPNYVEEPIVALIHQLAREFWFYETPFPINQIGYHFLEDYWLSKYRSVKTITVSQSTKNDLKSLGFQDVSIVPEGINVQPLQEVPRKNERPTLLFVGRLKEAKLPHHAIQAFKLLEEQIVDAKMHVVGDGYMLEKLRREYDSDGVTFHGYVSQEEKLELMKQSHLLLVPGVREGWGLVVTEANAMGTPAVGYDVPGLRDSIKDGRTGVLCDNSPESMSQEARRILGNGDVDELSRQALEDSRQYGWDRTAGEVEDVLEEMVI